MTHIIYIRKKDGVSIRQGWKRFILDLEGITFKRVIGPPRWVVAIA